MPESLLKSLKWYLLVLCAIIGTTAFIISDQTGSMKPVFIGVMCYGIVYIMSYFWREFRGKLLLLSILVFLGLTVASMYTPDLMYILFGHNQRWYDPYYTWAGTVAVFGIPIMALVFKRLD